MHGDLARKNENCAQRTKQERQMRAEKKEQEKCAADQTRMRNARRKRKYEEEMHADQQRTRSARAEPKQEQLSEKRARSKEQKMRPNISGKCRTGNVLKQLVDGILFARWIKRNNKKCARKMFTESTT